MPPTAKPSYQLIIGDQPFHIDWPTYNFHDEDPGYNAHFEGRTKHSESNGYPAGLGLAPYAPAQGLEGKIKRYRPRHYNTSEKRSAALAKQLVKQFVIHLDGCKDAEMCFNVLQNERGLSCHFILDNNGTIYQTLDLLDCAYHASGMNETSIGIEICNRGNAKLYPDYYKNSPKDEQREVVVCTVNNEKYVAYGYTLKQMEGMAVLAKTLAKLLPGIKLDYPKTSSGEQRWDTLDPTDKSNVRLRESYAGYLGHYHVTDQKWDPGPFDFKQFISKLSGHRAFPIGLHKLADKTEVPDAPPATPPKAYEDVFSAYYDNNELGGTGGGYFPVGATEVKPRLWHGGIHLHADRGSKVVAPLAGRVRLARNGSHGNGAGSTNFVLLSHSVRLGADEFNFFSLYFHLEYQRRTGLKKGKELPKWWANADWRNGEEGKVIFLGDGEPVQAGEVIGKVGQAGVDPPEPQLHWEIFSGDARVVLKADDKAHFWTQVSGATDQRFATAPEVMGPIDKSPKDGKFSIDELLAAYHEDYDFRDLSRHMMTYHYSEWSDYPDWVTALKGSPEFAAKPKEVDEIFESQLQDNLIFNDTIARRLGFSNQSPVYHYHPISFLKWINAFLGTDESAVKKASKADIDTASTKGWVDFDDKKGLANLEQNELQGKQAHQIELQDMVDGYGD